MNNAKNFFHSTWTIICRITKKYEKRSYTKKRTGEECFLFSFDCCDESLEIRFTAFEKLAEKFFDLIEEGHVYQISSHNSIKFKNELYNFTKHEFEVTCNDTTKIQKINDLTICEVVPLFYARPTTISLGLRKAIGSLVGQLLHT